MKIGDAEYIARVQQLLDEGKAISRSEARRVVIQTECDTGHKLTVMTPQECQAEIAGIQDGAVSKFSIQQANHVGTSDGVWADYPLAEPPLKKRRGRPLGSRNRPKESK